MGRLFVMAAIAELGYATLLKLDATNGPRSVSHFLGVMALLFVFYLLAARMVIAMPGKRTLIAVFGAALLFRLTLIPAGLPPGLDAAERIAALRQDLLGREVVYERFLLYDHDIWRFLWDGHVTRHQGNPYGVAPANEDGVTPLIVDHERERDWDHVLSYVNHPQHRTIYPPVAQGAFLLAHGISEGSVVAMKLVMIAADMLAMLFTALALRAAGKPAELSLLYGWNPLLVKVSAGSGHFDALVALALAVMVWAVLTRRRSVAAGAFASAVLVKFAPIVIFPLVARRIGAKRTVVAAGLIAAGLTAQRSGFGSLLDFGATWEFNAGFYRLCVELFAFAGGAAAGWARIACAITAAAVALLCVLRDRGSPLELPAWGAIVLGAAILCSPAIMPWYVAWVLPMAIVAGQHIWIVFSAVVCAAFFVMIAETLPPLVLWIEYGALAVSACVLGYGRRKPWLVLHHSSSSASSSPRPPWHRAAATSEEART